MIDMVDKTTMFTFIHTFQNEWKQQWGTIFPTKLAQAFKRDKTQGLHFITGFVMGISSVQQYRFFEGYSEVTT